MIHHHLLIDSGECRAPAVTLGADLSLSQLASSSQTTAVDMEPFIHAVDRPETTDIAFRSDSEVSSVLGRGP